MALVLASASAVTLTTAILMQPVFCLLTTRLSQKQELAWTVTHSVNKQSERWLWVTPVNSHL